MAANRGGRGRPAARDGAGRGAGRASRPAPATSRPGHRGTAWKTALLVVFAAAAAMAVGEVFLRVAYGGKFGPRPVFYAADDRLGWKPSANLDETFYGSDFSIRVRTDDAGYRLGARGKVDFGKRLVLLVGDSYTFGWGVSTGETFASFLDEKIADAGAGAMRVVNLGVGGYGTLQYAERLGSFARDHPGADVAAVIVVHCQNDAIDNVRSIGYQLGLWKSGQVEPARSRWHLVNFLRYARRLGRAADRHRADSLGNVDPRDPFLQDILWTHEIVEGEPLPPSFAVGPDTVSLVGLGRDDLSEAALAERKSLTRIQRELMYVGNKVIHSHARRMGCPVYHTYVYTTADWYIAEVDRQIRRSATETVFGLGRVPRLGSFQGPYFNKHSGKHYNVEFNRFWADRVFEILVDVGVAPAARAPAGR